MANFYFDIEAGGLTGNRHSIQSISYGTTPAAIQNLYAEPVRGSKYSKWTEDKVWKPIIHDIRVNRATATSEEAALKSFLSTIESLPENTHMVGWNIGYDPHNQRRATHGFDIPMLITRAERYGMGEQYKKAISRLKVKDIGQETAYRLSVELPKWKSQVKMDPALVRGIEGYAKKAAGQRRFPGYTLLSEPEKVEWLARKGVRQTGWTQEGTYRTLFGDEPIRVGGKVLPFHFSQADVAGMMKIQEGLQSRPLFQTAEDVSRWHRGALLDTLVNQAVNPARKESEAAERYTTLYKRAEAFNLQEEFTKTLRERVSTRAGTMEDIVRGLGAGPELERTVQSRVFSATPETAAAPFIDDFIKPTWNFLRKHKLAAGIIGGGAALYAAQPLGWFSGGTTNMADARIAPQVTRDRSVWHAKHLESMKRASSNGHRSGQRHRYQAGKVVI